MLGLKLDYHDDSNACLYDSTCTYFVLHMLENLSNTMRFMIILLHTVKNDMGPIFLQTIPIPVQAQKI